MTFIFPVAVPTDVCNDDGETLGTTEGVSIHQRATFFCL